MAVELQISMMYAGLLTLLYFALSVAVIRLRWRDRVGIGTGDSKDLEVATRIPFIINIPWSFNIAW